MLNRSLTVESIFVILFIFISSNQLFSSHFAQWATSGLGLSLTGNSNLDNIILLHLNACFSKCSNVTVLGFVRTACATSSDLFRIKYMGLNSSAAPQWGDGEGQVETCQVSMFYMLV